MIAAASLLTSAALAQTAVAPRARAITVVGGSGYLGIGAKDIDADRAKALKLPEVRGAEVVNVMEESPAAKAGFKEGDVVLEFNGQRVEGIEQLTRMVSETPAGRTVKILVSRNGSSVTLTPTLEAGRHNMISGGGTWAMPEIAIPPIPPMELPRFSMSYQNPMLGITGESLAQEEQFAEFLGVKDGVLVKSVLKDSAAEKAGIKAGDVIVKVDDAKVGSTREITSILRNVRAKKTVTVTVVRNKKEMPITVTIEPATVGSGVRARSIGPMNFTIPPVQVNMPRVMFDGPLVITTPGVRIIRFTPDQRL